LVCAHPVTGDIKSIHINTVESNDDHKGRTWDFCMVKRPLSLIVSSADTS
jgi:hypothetical protein